MLRSGMIIMIREKAQRGLSAYAIGKELKISKKYSSQVHRPTRITITSNRPFLKAGQLQADTARSDESGDLQLRRSFGEAEGRRV